MGLTAIVVLWQREFDMWIKQVNQPGSAGKV
jgi:hypothetical protein